MLRVRIPRRIKGQWIVDKSNLLKTVVLLLLLQAEKLELCCRINRMTRSII